MDLARNCVLLTHTRGVIPLSQSGRPEVTVFQDIIMYFVLTMLITKFFYRKSVDCVCNYSVIRGVVPDVTIFSVSTLCSVDHF